MTTGGLLKTQGKLSEAEPLCRRYAGSREMATARCLCCGTQHNLKKCFKCKVARFCGIDRQRQTWAEQAGLQALARGNQE